MEELESLSPEEVAAAIRASPWWVRERAPPARTAHPPRPRPDPVPARARRHADPARNRSGVRGAARAGGPDATGGDRASGAAVPQTAKGRGREVVLSPQRHVGRRRIRRRTDVVGIFPDRTSIIRLVGAVLAEQHDEWAEGRRYLALDVLSRARLTAVPAPQEVTTPQLPALSA